MTAKTATKLATRQPTGKPPWPIALLAGVEKAGKSFGLAQASASDLIGRTLWISVGEDDPDELGALPGARFEIVEHDGTYRGILNALQAAKAEPAGVKPTLLGLDSGTRLWDLLCDQAQHDANQRAKKKAEQSRRAVSEDDVQITMDLWNTAKQRWQHCIDVLREHQGPSIVTARLEQVAVVDAQGNPTKDKDWKIKAEKSLPYDAGVIVELPERGKAFLTGVRSLRFESKQARTEYPNFTMDKLWRDLGLAEKGATSARVHVANDPADKPMAAADLARSELGLLCDEHGWDKAEIAAEYADRANGQSLREATNAIAIQAFTKWVAEHWAEELAKQVAKAATK